MIHKLKKKFTLLATASMLLLMSLLILIMNGINYTSVIRESDQTLDVLSLPGAPFRKEHVLFFLTAAENWRRFVSFCGSA